MTIYLETERLILRRLTGEDVDNLLALDSDTDVLRWTNPGGQCAARAVYETDTLPRFLAYYERGNNFGYWAAIEKSTDRFLGWFHFRPARDNPDDTELGYRLLPIGRGQGYATEASRALVHKGFTELGVPRVTANTLADNAASRRVMEKAGLTFEKAFIYPGLGLPGVKYGLDQRNFRPSPLSLPLQEHLKL